MDVSVTILRDLAIVCAVSGLFALICQTFKIPLLIGYMIGGFLIGPHFFSNWIHGSASIEQLSELGVIFLMFYIGLEFDLKKLKKIFIPSSFWLTFQTIGMVAIGLMVAPLLGWTGLNGLFLGSMLVMSSTMITIPILKAKNALNTEYAQCAIGCLILEDILAIVFLVILSSVAGHGKIETLEITKSAFVIGVFVVMVFCFGKLVAPFFVRAIFKSSSAEVLVVTVIGFMMAICQLAHYFQFSVALGAFLAGSILSQSHIAEQIDKHTEPLRDVFNAVFFTSVGMMIDLKAIIHFWHIIVLLSIITFAGQTIIGTISLFLVGKKTETAFKAAFAKAQIGEFSFVIAVLGNSLGVLHKDFMSITVGVAVGTIVICVLCGHKSDNIFRFFDSHCPRFLSAVGRAYHNLLNEIKCNLSNNGFLKLATRQLLSALLWFFLLSGTLFSVAHLAALTRSGEFGVLLSHILRGLSKIFCWINQACAEQIPEAQVLEISLKIFQIFIWAGAYLICIPFLIGIAKNIQEIFTNLIKNSFNKRARQELFNNRVFGVMRAISIIVALFLFSGIFLGIAAKYLPNGIPVILFGTIAIILASCLWHQLSKLNNRLELAFIESFNDKIESQEQLSRKSILSRVAANNPWPIEIAEIVLHNRHDIIGKQLSELHLRELTGATLVAISRGGLSTYKVGPDMQFFPHDKLILLGTKTQINDSKIILLKESEEVATQQDNSQFDILSFCVGHDNNFMGHLLSDLHLRQEYGLNVVGIQRDEEKIVDIKPNIELRQDDILLLAGTKSAIKAFKSQHAPE